MDKSRNEITTHTGNAMLSVMTPEEIADAYCQLRRKYESLRLVFRLNMMHHHPTLTHAEIDREIERAVQGD